MSEERPKGFAAMLEHGGEEAEKRVRAIASMGGRAAHEPGISSKGRPRKRGHEWTPEAAREAGRRGGLATAKKRKRKDTDS
jgi:hypothetical protein